MNESSIGIVINGNSATFKQMMYIRETGVLIYENPVPAVVRFVIFRTPIFDNDSFHCLLHCLLLNA